MILPSLKNYKDINKDTVFTDFKIESVECYLEQVNKSIDEDVNICIKTDFLSTFVSWYKNTKIFFRNSKNYETGICELRKSRLRIICVMLLASL